MIKYRMTTLICNDYKILIGEKNYQNHVYL